MKTHPIDEELATKAHPQPEVIQRRCRDVIFLIIFIVFAIGEVALGAYAVINGDINRLRYGNEELGHLCGVANNMTDGSYDYSQRPKLHFAFFLDDFDDAVRVCLEACPAQGDVICKYGVEYPTSDQDSAEKIADGRCSYTLWNTKSVLNRCFPTDIPESVTTAFGNTYNETDSSILLKAARFVSDDLNGRDFLAQIYESILDTWQVILGCAGAAIVISFAWLVLSNLVTGVTVLLTILLALVLTAIPAGFLLYNYYLVTVADKTQFNSGITLIDSRLGDQYTVLAVGIVFAVLFFAIFIFVLTLRKRIKLAIILMREANKYDS